MSMFTRSVLELFSFPRYVLLNRQLRDSRIRTLYSAAALGLDNYSKTRERVQNQFTNMADRFRSKMEEISHPESKNLVFTEDLKNMVHLAGENDVELVLKMLRRFNNQSKDLRFGTFVFGPVVMRMFYYLNKPDEALNAFKDSALDGIFDQLISYQLLLDLLYKNEKYQDMLTVFEMIKDKQIQNARFPKNVVVLTMAACYKLNSEDSLKYASDLWKNLQEVGHQPTRRAATFIAALALNQNAPHITAEIISNVGAQNYITIRNLKAAALADLNRLEDAVAVLRRAVQVDNPNQAKVSFTKDVVEKVKAASEREERKEIAHEAQALLKRLSENGHTVDQILDDMVCTEIAVTDLHGPRNRERRYIAATFERTERRDTPRSYQRPGLRDLL
ncbi:pentatricopeptide repeat-containing protein 2, mitochondrial-like isoform X1 [Schistocerca piceifrons]|uniref:pentatricopeptide repeat-containing protein 2, mitochondrial-like isoform X1 n=1 Tax=Schistocerca piceifrons TaxID=274613 RepID=UPI001F5F82DE|nr:pentatricopeptide repeat-containing protein 2, mitochondrial-like isoform X1 [Schistocerca piceifrons]